MASTALLHRPAVSPAAGRPGLGQRLRVRLHSAELTRRLASGADPSSTPELALLARRLTSAREVRECVAGLERVMREAVAPSRTFTAVAPVNRAAIRAARPFLDHLLACLREADAPRAAGMARVELLLSDGCGPLYAPAPPGELAATAFRAAEGI
jgi:hypothetical protein